MAQKAAMYWNDGQLVCIPTDSGTCQRRIRARQVRDEDSYTIPSDLDKGVAGVNFGSTIVRLMPTGVACSCPDFFNRRLPCKHIFASADILGDKEAILEDRQAPSPPPSPQKSPAIATKAKKEGHNKISLNLVPPELQQFPTGSANGMKPERPQDIRISRHFLMSDLLYGHSVILYGIPNLPEGWQDPDDPEVQGMVGLATKILDPVVDQFGPISVTFAYCSLDYWGDSKSKNDLHSFRLKRGGVGGAADILVHQHKDNPRLVINWIRDNCEYDRLILYPPPRPVICTAWTSVSPRYHCKEWITPPDGGKKQYINVRREV